MNTDLPDWFRSAKLLAPPDDQFAKYDLIIVALSDSKKLSHSKVLNLVRLAYGLEAAGGDGIDWVQSICTKHLPSLGKGQTRTLAFVSGAALMKLFKLEDDNDWKVFASLVLVCASFNQTRAALIFQEILDAALAALAASAASARKIQTINTDISEMLTLPLKTFDSDSSAVGDDDSEPAILPDGQITALEDRIRSTLEDVLSIQTEFVKSFNTLGNNQKILEEENALLTWLVNRHVRSLDQSLVNFSKPESLAVGVGLDLFWLIKVTPPHPTLKEFCQSTLEIKPKKRYTLQEFIDATPERLNTEGQWMNLSDCKDICPVSFAFDTKRQHASPSVWLEIVKKATKLDLTKKFSPAEIAFQVVLEQELLNLL
jgi:hypothetical protein